MRTRLSALLVVAACGGMPAVASAADRLVPGFDLQSARMQLGRPAAAAPCPPPPPPVVDMGGLMSRYDPKDPTQSRVDQGREAQSKTHDAGMAAFATQVTRLSDRALHANPPDPATAACFMSQLAAWARADALERNVDQNDRVGRNLAIMQQAWQLATYASAFAKVGGFEAVPAADADVVRAWMQRLARSVLTNYSGAATGAMPVHNLEYWAAYAVASAGVILNDRTMLQFGRDVLHAGLASAADDGSLPAEIARGSRAYSYQLFATMPLAGLVALADRNGMPLREGEEKALERIVQFDASNFGNPVAVEKLANAKQEPVTGSFNLAWIDILNAHFARANPQIARMLDDLAAKPGTRPMSFIYLGGDVTSPYNPQALRR